MIRNVDLNMHRSAQELVDNLVGYLMYKLKNPDAALHLADELNVVYDRLEKNPYQYPESSDDFLRSREWLRFFCCVCFLIYVRRNL